jgi:ribosomal protein S18 acetylase RimI-like enzyme
MAINFSLVKIIPADEPHYEFIYRVKKEAYGEYITQVWGWDEDKQREFFAQDWQELKPSVILYNNEPIGTICVSTSDGNLNIERFYILPEYQNKGIGSYLVKRLLEKADKQNLIAKLCVLKINPAISLYRRHGYEIIDEDEIMYHMERKPSKNYEI